MTSFPQPSAIKNADICRDGGTYVMVYATTNDGDCELELPVRLDGNYNVVGYDPPTLLLYETKAKMQLHWDGAESLAAVLPAFVDANIGWGGPSRALEMIAFLRAKGDLRLAVKLIDEWRAGRNGA